MKTLVNWYVVFKDEFGEEGIGILLPGCTLTGELVESKEKITIEVLDVDMGNMTIIDVNNEQYKLLDASRDYLQDLNKCIEIGLKERDEETR
ncbi:MAG: hypothetical protein IKL68_04960 [Clostridia bacterium]|nr:hypothetical protein [Clostridia bacterium]